jgi:hypothetical protein
MLSVFLSAAGHIFIANATITLGCPATLARRGY